MNRGLLRAAVLLRLALLAAWWPVLVCAHGAGANPAAVKAGHLVGTPIVSADAAPPRALAR